MYTSFIQNERNECACNACLLGMQIKCPFKKIELTADGAKHESPLTSESNFMVNKEKKEAERKKNAKIEYNEYVK